jgi:formylglycine-generating enzyme required for sulfatase activity
VRDGQDTSEMLWGLVAKDFPAQAAAMAKDAQGKHLNWFIQSQSTEMEQRMIARVLKDTGAGGDKLRASLKDLTKGDAEPGDARWLGLYAKAVNLRDRLHTAKAQMARLNLGALRLAIEDLCKSYPERYPNGAAYLKRVETIQAALAQGDEVDLTTVDQILAFQEEVLLSNPLLDFDELLVLRRNVKGPSLGLPCNWQGNCSLPRSGYDDEIAVLSPPAPDGALTTRFRPETARFVGDVDLHFEADTMLFSMQDERKLWQIWEAGVDGSGLRQVSPAEEDDVDNYDACYLPDGRILYSSTAPMHGVPCVDGSSHVANLYLMDEKADTIRQLCFDQEHNWCVTPLNNGRVMYLRWEYTDTPHSQTRLLFSMNPDGTGQMEYYGSNSYWPNGIFYARPVPGHPTMVAGIVTGHHGLRRMGELALFDPAKGRHEADGAVQRIPGHQDTVEPIIRDQLANGSWPMFLHPYPLSEKYLLVSAKPTPQSNWGIYLVDIFDNMVLLKEETGFALLEPIPLRETPRPPAIPDKVNLARKDAEIYMADIYEGGGLKGIPRGTVKKLRVFSYHYGFRGMGGLLGVLGMDGPWDIKRVLGTVPVEADGSALFSVPANTPIAVQPLDEEGKALQQMRSWFTAMPGEVLSCVGCHEQQNSGPITRMTMAARREPDEITPWYGPTRGFSFAREVQPVIDKHCMACHKGVKGRPDLRGTEMLTDWRSVTPGQGGRLGGKFSVAYAALHKYVRRPGIESDYHMLTPMEFHADTTELVQMLKKGHHNVALDEEAWDRLVTWIDLNAPFHGYWHELEGEKALKLAARQVELGLKYGGTTVNTELVPDIPREPVEPIAPKMASKAEPAARPTWSFGARTAKRKQRSAAKTLGSLAGTQDDGTRRSIEVAEGISVDLTLVPAGQFAMGEDGATRAAVEEPFWMGRVEVSNALFALFDPDHDSRIESKHAYQFGVHGFPLNGPDQPVVRVSWEQAVAFCEWLSARTGKAFSLPSETQWEYACRAGAATPFSYGDASADFSRYANLADMKLREFADDPYKVFSPLKNATPYDDWIPRDNRFNDGGLVSVSVGSYEPNAWGLHDMHGNVWEWTGDSREVSSQTERVVRGGSWYDRPKRAHAGARLAYKPYQQVFNVGFRVSCRAGRVQVSKN